MDIEQIKSCVSIEEVLQRNGVSVKPKGSNLVALCPFHDDHHPSLVINPAKKLWFCGPCGMGGSVIDMHMKLHGCTLAQTLNELGGNWTKQEQEQKKAAPPVKQKVVATYYYEDATGTVRYRVHRIEPGDNGKGKKFCQERLVGDEFKPGMTGVELLLYKLPNVMRADTVWLVEGEGKVDALDSLGFAATTCTGGGGSWMQGYAEWLRDKHIVIAPDSDETGQKWEKAVHESLAGVAATVRFVRMPKGINDVADFITLQPSADAATTALREMMDKAQILTRGIDLPIYSAEEMSQRYDAFIRQSASATVDLSRWLPSLSELRPLWPGEMMTLMADTGVGKSACLQNIAYALPDLVTLLFELELPDSLIFERQMSLHHGLDGRLIEQRFKAGERLSVEGLENLYVCPKAHMTTTQLEDYIVRSELKIGRKPHVVMVDYIGLMAGGVGKRYERMSTIAEQLKVIAKATNVVMILASQVHRPPTESAKPRPPGVSLHDAKDSGSIENSSGLVIGAWKEAPDHMVLKILKSTKGGAGKLINCNFDGAKMRITERWNGEMP